jgi:hypothetical protein
MTPHCDRGPVAFAAQPRVIVAQSSFSRLVAAGLHRNIKGRRPTRASERSSQMAKSPATPQQGGPTGPSQQQQGDPSPAPQQQGSKPIFRDWAAI